ncbi:hypothetical protein CSOJ01_02862 [Colletotrichum sojae]|uniref:Uncharacterized protein n=1 Tax=Colletotrichum sojae TaxID=2175907 RepID=A0A8H6JP15_9PEZI|nr:hypothetical protein CSOJ01_02862 [Colletotrichum sojae]
MPEAPQTRPSPGETRDSGSKGGYNEDVAHRSLLDGSDAAAASESYRDKRRVEPAAVWRPTWLQPSVSWAFVTLFLLFSASLPTMLWYSLKHDGLVPIRQSLVYLWRFGPTGVITIFSLLWSRVEVQALRYMPWIAHRYGMQPAEDANAYDLDYTALLPHSILVQSIRNGHYFVFWTTVASLLLKLQIVLAPGLYSLTKTHIAQPADIRVLDSFHPIEGDVSLAGTSSYYLAQALHSYDMQYPFGLTENEAYQTFRNENGTTFRGTTEAALDVVVDAYIPDTQCLKLESRPFSNITREFRAREWYYIYYDIHLRFEGCDQTIVSSDYISMKDNIPEDQEQILNDWMSNMTLLPSRPCDNLPQESNQTLYYVASFEKAPGGDPSQRTIRDVAAVLCSSISWLSKVRVVDDGVKPVVTRIPGEPKRLMSMNLWETMSNAMPLFVGKWYGEETQRAWGPVNAEHVLSGKTAGADDSGISDIPTTYTTDDLYESTIKMSRIIGTVTGHSRLRQIGSVSETHVIGSTTTSIDMLKVNKWICLSMSAIFVLLTGITSILALWHSKKTIVWFRDPATILGSILFFHDYPDVLRHATDYTRTGDATNWSRCNFTPLVLKTWIRAVVTILLCAVITALLSGLHLSETSQGLATVSDEGYIHLLWTSIPTLVVLSIALYVSACSNAYRSRSILSLLSQRETNAEYLDTSFSDMLEPRVLALSLSKKLGAVSLAQLLAILCGFLTTLVSVIFTMETIPETKSIQLQQATWLGSRDLDDPDVMRNRRRVLSSLVLHVGDATMNYPINTHDDLVFPSFQVENILDPRGNPNSSIRATIPAARLDGNCFRMQPYDDPNLKISAGHRVQGDTFDASVMRVLERMTCPNGTRRYLDSRFPYSVGQNSIGRLYVAGMMNSPGNLADINSACDLGLNETTDFKYTTSRSQTYAWGEYSAVKEDFAHFTMWRCNYTWMEVPTEINLVVGDGEYVLDPENPPQPDMSRARPWDPPLDVPEITKDQGDDDDGAFPQVALKNPLMGLNFPDQIRVLAQPFGPFEPEAFGDPNREIDMITTLQHNYAFLAAQLANVELRLNASENSRTSPAPPSGLPAIDAVMTDMGRRRLIQNPTVTYVIVVILVLVVLANFWLLLSAASRRLVGKTWVLDPEVKGLAPDGFNSIAAMAALLRDSNVPNYLPESPELLPGNEFYGRLSDLTFRMGWFENQQEKAKYFTVGATVDDDFKFIGSREDVSRAGVLE